MTKRTPFLVRSRQHTHSSPALPTNFHLLAIAIAMTIAIALVLLFSTSSTAVIKTHNVVIPAGSALPEYTVRKKDSTKLKASRKVNKTHRVVASRDKLLVPVRTVVSNVSTVATFSKTSCDYLGSRIYDEVKRIVVRADCIVQKFGKHIDAQVASGKTAVLITAGLNLSQVKHLLIAITLEESRGNPHAVCIPSDKSKAKSEGLMQLTPDTMARFGGGNAFNPVHNYRAGYGALTTYAALFIGLPHAIERTLIGYHIGPYHGREGNRKFLYRESFDPRSDGYVRRVLRNYNVLEAHGHVYSEALALK